MMKSSVKGSQQRQGMSDLLVRLWYRPGMPDWRLWPLAPLSAVYGLVSAARRLLWRLGVKPVCRLDVPVIVVGNITAGGTGKTPLVAWLCDTLRAAGYKPGIVSRGYGGKCAFYPFEVRYDSDPVEVGDEPLMLRRRTRCPVVVSPKRPTGANYLVQQLGCDVVISDDGLQHYALGRDIELAVIDGERRLGNGWLLPMGPLRETRRRLRSVSYVVANGTAAAGEYAMELKPGSFHEVSAPEKSISSQQMASQDSVAFAGIGNPDRFFATLASLGISPHSCNAFADHHAYTREELEDLRGSSREALLMTEKDAVKCASFHLPNCWYLPVTAKLSDEFAQALLNELQQSTVSKKQTYL